MAKQQSTGENCLRAELKDEDFLSFPPTAGELVTGRMTQGKHYSGYHTHCIKSSLSFLHLGLLICLGSTQCDYNTPTENRVEDPTGGEMVLCLYPPLLLLNPLDDMQWFLLPGGLT